MESEESMNIVIGFVNGREKIIKADDYSVDEENGYLKILKDDYEVGMVAFSQIVYWFMED